MPNIDLDLTTKYVMYLDRESKNQQLSMEASETLKAIATHLQDMHSRVLELELDNAKFKSAKHSSMPPADLAAVDRMLDDLDPAPEFVLEDDDVVEVEHK